MKQIKLPEDIELGKRIKRVRLELSGRPMTQIEFARELGVERGSVGNWELGRGASRKHLTKIAVTFELNFEWLATGLGDPYQGVSVGLSLDEKLREIEKTPGGSALARSIREQVDREHKRIGGD